MSDIDDRVRALATALENDDEKAGLAVTLALVGGALRDIRRIADAVDILAKPATPADADK